MSCYHLIVNPVAGKGRAWRLLPDIETRLLSCGASLCVYVTKAPGDARRLAETLPQNADVLVLGGDGTLHEVVAACTGSERTIGLIPGGSGDDFAATLGVRQWRQALDVIRAGRTRMIDTSRVRLYDLEEDLEDDSEATEAANNGANDGVGDSSVDNSANDSTDGANDGVRDDVRDSTDDVQEDANDGGNDGVRERTAINACGLGFDADVAARIRELPHWLAGTAAYIYAALRALFALSLGTVTVRVDGAEVYHGRSLLVSVQNGRRVGGGFVFAPDADPGDGLLDVVVAGALTRREVIALFPRLFRGTLRAHPKVRWVRGRQVEVDWHRPQPLHIDGEPLEPLRHLSVTLCPAAVRFYVP
ncbi:MAG: diacylglycerol kinase family protein [Trueperaceae bacterium]|nr:diacylglycerol kinase family protein [Trueperaceae bacterium]